MLFRSKLEKTYYCALKSTKGDRERLPSKFNLTMPTNLLDRKPDKHQFDGVSGYLGADYQFNHPAGIDGGSYYLRVISDFAFRPD